MGGEKRTIRCTMSAYFSDIVLTSTTTSTSIIVIVSLVAQKEKNRRDLGTILSAHNVGIPNAKRLQLAIGIGPS